MKKFSYFTTRIVENLNNIFFQLVNSNRIAKLNVVVDFFHCKCKIVALILTIFTWSSKHLVINSIMNLRLNC